MLLHTCNLRKGKGFHLVAQCADPIPPAQSARGPYQVRIVKAGPLVHFGIGLGKMFLTLFEWHDNGEDYGPVLGGGRIGFRQMSPLIAEYANLTVRKVEIDA